MPTPPISRISLHIMLLVGLMCMLTGCQTVDPEYQHASSKVSDAEVPPKKIVGEWVSIIIAPWGEFKTSFKFLPDGSGLLRRTGKFNDGTRSLVEQDMQWTYTGANKWQVRLGAPRILAGNPVLSFRVREPFTIRSYREVLLQSGGRVLVPMDDDERVKAKLQQMRAEAIRQGT